MSPRLCTALCHSRHADTVEDVTSRTTLVRLAASRIAVGVAVEYLREHLDIDLPHGNRLRCAFTARNAQCACERCPFFDAKG